MAKRRKELPKPNSIKLSKTELLSQLEQVDRNNESRERVLRLEMAFRRKIDSHIISLPRGDAQFKKFNTSPYVLLIHARQKSYTKISELESDILPAKQFSSMETSAGRMVEEVVLPEYGWAVVPSEMHTANSALDGRKVDPDVYRLTTLKSGPRCLNDEMSENFADAIINNYAEWSTESGLDHLDFTYGVLYGSKKQSNKKDWHILRNLKEKIPDSITVSPDNQWHCQFQKGGVTVDVSIRIGLDWWRHLGGKLCFVEVFTALIRACINAGAADSHDYDYMIADLGDITDISCVEAGYNVSLLQRSQLPWLFLMAKHFCDSFTDN